MKTNAYKEMTATGHWYAPQAPVTLTNIGDIDWMLNDGATEPWRTVIRLSDGEKSVVIDCYTKINLCWYIKALIARSLPQFATWKMTGSVACENISPKKAM
jgi:hypothetical protein